MVFCYAKNSPNLCVDAKRQVHVYKQRFECELVTLCKGTITCREKIRWNYQPLIPVAELDTCGKAEEMGA